MASAIIHRRTYRGRFRSPFRPVGRFILLSFLAFVGLLVLIVGTLAVLKSSGVGESTTRTIGGALALGFLGAVGVLGNMNRRHYLRGLRLRADSEAVGSSGGESLLQVLLKINSFPLAVTVRLDALGFRARFSIWPRLSERIRNLQMPRSPRAHQKSEFRDFNKFWGMEPKQRKDSERP